VDQPRFWRKLDRHPLSAEYPDISGPSWERFVANLKAVGIVGRRKVTLHPDDADGGKLKVLDAWQLYRGCLEADIKPDFQPLPKGITPEAYVETMNDHRRQESMEVMELRAAKRRERVAAARANGQSIRTIAQAEGVSTSTIHNDLQQPGVRGEHLDSAAPKVTGSDGKQYDANKPRGGGKILCSRCERIAKPYGIKDCASCAELNKKGGKTREPGEDDQPLDSDGKPMPKKKPGKPIYDDKKIEAAYGTLARCLNDRAIAHGLKDIPRAVKSPMNEVFKEFQEWQKRS
jgi:hypothetical protein